MDTCHGYDGRKAWRHYVELGCLLAPLATVQLGADIGEQTVNTALSRASKSSTEMLSAFTAVYFIVKFMSGMVFFFRPLAAVPLKTSGDVRFVTKTLLLISSVLTCFLVVCALTPLGILITGIPDVQIVRLAFVSISFLPFFDGSVRLCQGLLVRRRLSNWMAMASLADIVFQIIAASVILTLNITKGPYILVTSISPIYIGRVANISTLAFGLYRNPNYLIRPLEEVERIEATVSQTVHLELSRQDGLQGEEFVSHFEAKYQPPPFPSPKHNEGYNSPNSPNSHPSDGIIEEGLQGGVLEGGVPLAEFGRGESIFLFAWPLVLTDVVQKASRPLVNSYIAHTQGHASVAVLGLIYPIAHMPYGWLNALKVMHPAYLDSPFMRKHRIPWFTVMAITFSVTWGLIATLTGLNQVLLSKIAKVSPDLVHYSFDPLMIFAMFGVPVGIRAVLTGKLVADKQTQALTLSGVVRLPGIILSLIVLERLGVRNATLGVAGLFSGFLVQCIGVIIGFLYASQQASPRDPKHNTQITQEPTNDEPKNDDQYPLYRDLEEKTSKTVHIPAWSTGDSGHAHVHMNGYEPVEDKEM
ncbi:hypothetical protein AAMO2058_000567900 [Amorphochlora amoebiformis]